jgi:hypothetical protein
VELFEELRREYEFGVGSIAGVARKFGVHRRLVREALGCAIPQEQLSKGRPRPNMRPPSEFIDGVLEADRRAPRKQRHTAHRIRVRTTQTLWVFKEIIMTGGVPVGHSVTPAPLAEVEWPAERAGANGHAASIGTSRSASRARCRRAVPAFRRGARIVEHPTPGAASTRTTPVAPAASMSMTPRVVCCLMLGAYSPPPQVFVLE